jgi:hypothetical protein
MPLYTIKAQTERLHKEWLVQGQLYHRLKPSGDMPNRKKF